MPTHVEQLSPDEIVRRGSALYEQTIRPGIERDYMGWFLVIDVLTGEYEMSSDDVDAAKRAKARFGEHPLFAVRVGYPATYRLGGRFKAASA